MADLRDFLGLEAAATIQQVSVYNTDTDGLTSGQCCLYTVPTGVSAATIELWGGGGTGGGACCCMWPYRGATAGQYVMKKISVAEGTALTICAAGTTPSCSCYCDGCNGYPSFVLCNGTNVACADGGCRGRTLCWYWSFNCGGNCDVRSQDSNGVGDIRGCKYTGYNHASFWCHNDHINASQGAPKYNANLRFGGSPCVVELTKSGCCYNKNAWPGGPGMSGAACGGGYCWNGWGAAGLVIVTFYG
jgi:hypothetical protein